MYKTSQPAPIITFTREYEKKAQAETKKYDISIPEQSDIEICIKGEKQIDYYMTNARQYTHTVIDARAQEKEAQIIARTYNLPIPELSDTEILIKAKEEIDNYMARAHGPTITIDNARDLEKRAQAVARTYNLPIPRLSLIEIRVKEKMEVEQYMIWARTYMLTRTMEQAREYERKAQVAASKYNLPIPKLSDVDLHIKVEEEVKDYIRRAQWEINVDLAKYYEEEAQALAKTYNLSIPKLSDIKICVKVEKKIERTMEIARQESAMVIARFYENSAQNMAKEYNIPIPELSNADMEKIRQREMLRYV
jgi:hypothetical protein